mgnify:FL=1
MWLRGQHVFGAATGSNDLEWKGEKEKDRVRDTFSMRGMEGNASTPCTADLPSLVVPHMPSLPTGCSPRAG